MSKSLGNMYTLSDLETMGYNPEEVRYVLAGAYYRRPLNFMLESLMDARAALQRLARFSKALQEKAGIPAPSYKELRKEHPGLGAFAPAWESLNDDLNTPEALGYVFSALKKVDVPSLDKLGAAEVLKSFHFILEAMGIVLPSLEPEKVDVPADVRELAERRQAARLARDWATSDLLRDELQQLGWVVKDKKEGYDLLKA